MIPSHHNTVFKQQCHGAPQSQWPLRVGRVQVARSSSNNAIGNGQAADVRDGRLSLQEQLQQFISPQKYAANVMQGVKYAWGKTNVPPKDTMFVADPTAARQWLSNEWNLGINSDWLPSIRALLGNTAVSITQDSQLHTRLRQLMNPFFTTEAIQRQMPAIHKKVQTHMDGWASKGSIGAYDAARLMTFDILVNQALSLSMSDQELSHYSKVFQDWVDGFTPPAIDLPFLPFGKGMAARRKLQQRVWQALADPNIPANSLLARLRDEYGAESEIAADNIITMLFAGHDTTSSAISFLLWQLSKKPEVLLKLREEHQQVVATHGSELTPSAIAAMAYTQAVMKETLRLAQVVAYVPRVATKTLTNQSGQAVVPSGCPFLVALSQMSANDPAVGPHKNEFNPDRWLDPQNAKTLAIHQMPFGLGQHYCLGSQLAQAELTAVLTELARRYDVVAEVETEWVDFPIKRPVNGLPCKVAVLSSRTAALNSAP